MSPPSRRFLVRSDANGNKRSIQVGELAGIVAENLGLATWGAAVVLADILHRWTDEVKTDLSTTSSGKGIPILELGAGTGLAGLTAAALWGLPAVLTDLEPVLAGIEFNIRLNPELRASAGGLDWTKPETLVLRGNGDVVRASETKADIILAADTCYSEEHGDLISSTVSIWLRKRRGAKVIICYPLRMSYIEHVRGLWRAMEGKGLVCVEEGREQAEELWGEVAPVPYEWSVWGWKESWPEVQFSGTGDEGEWLAM